MPGTKELDSTGAWDARIVGREPELSELHEFLDADRSPRSFVLTGEPGIGKTTLWEAGIDAARERGLRVLSARSGGAEARLSFGAEWGKRAWSVACGRGRASAPRLGRYSACSPLTSA